MTTHESTHDTYKISATYANGEVAIVKTDSETLADGFFAAFSCNREISEVVYGKLSPRGTGNYLFQRAMTHEATTLPL